MKTKFSINKYPDRLRSSKGERQAAIPSRLVNQTPKRLDTDWHSPTPQLKTKARLAFFPSQS